MVEFEDIFSQLSTTKLHRFEVDEYILGMDILYNTEQAYNLSTIGHEICKSNHFDIVLSNEPTKNRKHKILSIDFLHHNLDFLIKNIHNNFATKTVPTEVIKIFESLEFIVPKKNQEAIINNDLDKLLIWANQYNISKTILPRTKERLLALEVLNLSDISLQTIPKYIRVLKNLKKIYLVNCQLTKLPLEIFALNNLEILWVQNNHLTTVSKEINNLIHLQELVLYENNIQSLPSIYLKQLSFIALHGNFLSAKEIGKFIKTIPENIKTTFYKQREKLPFTIEPLSRMTLKEAEKLRDSIFDDDIEDIEKDLLLASLNITHYKKILENNDLTALTYWVAKESVSKRVIGLTGIYTEIDDKENCWLGWFCVDKLYRKNGFGKKLLEFSIEQAAKMEKKYLYLYTYNSKKFQTAIQLYNKYEFQEFQEKSSKNKLELYFKKDLIKNSIT